MSDSLPTGWAETTFADLGRWCGGGTPSKSNAAYWSNGTIPWVSPKDMKTLCITTAEDKITEEALAASATSLIPPESLLMVTRSGILARTLPVAKTVVPVAINQDLKALTPSEGVNSDYVLAILRWLEWAILNRCAKAGTTVRNINFPEFLRFQVPLPPLNEQRRIVAKIEALMARSARAREALDAIPALLDRYRQSVLAAAFRGDLTADWREQHPDVEPASELLEEISKERQARLLGSMGRRRKRKADDGFLSASAPPEIPGYELPNGWALARLTDLSWQSSYGISSKCDYNFPGPPVLRIPNVANGRLLLDDLKRAGEEGFDDADSVDLGDLLVVRTNGSRSLIGRGVVITQPLSEATYFASYLIRFRLLGGIDMARWLATLWHSPQVRAQVYEHAATSAGQYNVSLSELSGFAIPIPPVDELRLIYRRVEAALTSIDLVTDEVRAGTERSALLDQSILAKAFRGELVPQDPNDEPASALLARIKAERAAKPLQRVRGRRRKAQEETDDMPLFPGSSSDKPLADILNSNNGSMKAESLWQASGLSIDDFYKQLKREVEGGLIREDKNTQLLLTSP